MTSSDSSGRYAALLLAGLLAAGTASTSDGQDPPPCSDQDLELYCTTVDAGGAPVVDGNGNLATTEWSTCGNLVPTRQPVLFVHGHSDFGLLAQWISTCKASEHECNWLSKQSWDGKSLPSFGDALVVDWPRLGIEPYFLQLDEQNRAVEIDACLIERAVRRILERHGDPTAEAVKLVLVGYSKGSISSRLYLEHLRAAQDAARPFAPVSEFVAISPPNHGLAYQRTLTVSGLDTNITTSLALRQLNNGYDEDCVRLCCDEGTCPQASTAACLKPFSKRPRYPDCQSNALCQEDASLGFITGLNSGGETPGGRPAPLARSEGVLFLTLYDPEDAAGGSTYGDSCAGGRLLAKNLGPDAVNREMRVPPDPVVESSDPLVVHGNAPHTPEVICQALYTAAHRHLPPDGICPSAQSDADYEIVPSIPLDHPGVVLVLDVSGSMSRTPEGKIPDPDSGERSKLSMVQAAAQYFLSELAAWGENRSHFGLATFPARSQGSPASCSGQGRFPMSLVTLGAEEGGSGSVEGAEAEIEALTAAGNTPLLAGLDKALAMFGGEDAKAIVVLTDGFQNCPPQAAPDETIARASGSQVALYPIGFGHPVEVDSVLLEQLAKGTGAADNFYDVTQGLTPEQLREWNHESALKGAFKEILSQALDLQVGADPLGAIGHGGRFSRPIWLNEHDHRVSFGLSWITLSAAGPRRLRLRVFSSDGGEVTPERPGVRVYAGPKHEIVTVDETFLRLPGKVGDAAWRLEIEAPGLAPGETESYHYDVLLDSQLEMSVAFDQPAYAAGDEVTLTAELKAAGRPLTGARVTAEIHRPEDGLGNWFAAHTVTEDELEQVPEERDGELLPRFVRKAIFLNELRATPLPGRLSLAAKTLNDEGRGGDRVAGDGVYTLRLREAPREGTYLFQVRATSSPEADGPRFHRERSVQRHFSVRPAAEATSVKIEEIPLEEQGPRRFRIWVSPQDRLGNYLGPRFAQSVHLEASQGSFVTGAVADHLDGRYSLDLELLADQDPADTRISVDARGAQQSFVLTDKLSQWLLSLHLGLAVPQGRLARDFDDGLAAGLDVKRSLSGRFFAVGLLEYHGFRSAVAGAGDTHWWNVSANLEYRGRARTVSWYAAGGLGGYVPKNGSARPGANLELGFRFSRRGRGSLELGAGYHRIFTSGSDAEFLVPGLRWLYRL